MSHHAIEHLSCFRIDWRHLEIAVRVHLNVFSDIDPRLKHLSLSIRGSEGIRIAIGTVLGKVAGDAPHPLATEAHVEAFLSSIDKVGRGAARAVEHIPLRTGAPVLGGQVIDFVNVGLPQLAILNPLDRSYRGVLHSQLEIGFYFLPLRRSFRYVYLYAFLFS